MTISNSLPEPSRTLFLWFIELLTDVIKKEKFNKLNVIDLGNYFYFFLKKNNLFKHLPFHLSFLIRQEMMQHIFFNIQQL